MKHYVKHLPKEKGLFLKENLSIQENYQIGIKKKQILVCGIFERVLS